MLKKISSITELFIEKTHQRIFKQPMGKNMYSFIKSFGLVSLGSSIATCFLFVTNMVAGRWLGPDEYGKYSMVIYLGNFFIIPMVMGINTSIIKHLASTQKEETQNKIISSSL